MYHQPVTVVCDFCWPSMMCNLGRFPTIRHNEIKDFTVSILCHNVTIQQHSKSLNGEGFHYKYVNTEDNVSQLDVHTCTTGFWNCGQGAYFDLRIFYSHAPSYCLMDFHAHQHYMTDMDQKRIWTTM